MRYRREGGPRQHLIPDFLIAAHAQVQCNRLAAIDRGYLRRYFPKLKLLIPPQGRGRSQGFPECAITSQAVCPDGSGTSRTIA
jgi:hypothetical protein